MKLLQLQAKSLQVTELYTTDGNIEGYLLNTTKNILYIVLEIT